MQEQVDNINQEIKNLRDKMYETKLAATISPDENYRKQKSEEYNDLVGEMKKLMSEKYQIIGGEENDKYKRK